MKNIKELGLELIELEDQILLVDKNQKLSKGDWHIEKNQIINQFPDYLTDIDDCVKIIASSKQLEGLPLLVIEDEDIFVFNTLPYEIKEFLHSISFRKGFRKAKETYKFTEEDIVEFLNWVGNDGYPCIDKSKKGLWVLHPQEPKDFTVKELLQIWKEQRTKKELYVEVEEVLQVRHGTNWYDLPNQKSGRDPEGIYQTDIRLKITDNKIKAVWK